MRKEGGFITFRQYLVHYFRPGYMCVMLLAAIVAAAISLAFAVAAARRLSVRYTPQTQALFIRDEVLSLSERYYELIFSCTSILLFVGVYFTIDYFGVPDGLPGSVWDTYGSIILLGFILTSILFNSLMDRVFIPLKHMRKGERATMRLMGMLYMIVIFAYIKYVYADDNYDTIILYFITLVIGRFVYFDASLESFQTAMKETMQNLPLLILALLSSGLIALVGFLTGYLLRQNGVVLNLFFGHLYLILVIFMIYRGRLLQRLHIIIP